MKEEEVGHTFSLPHGRQLGYLIVGEGNPVFHFHGSCSSRLEVLLLKSIASSMKLQIIGVDRPGFGLSTFLPKRRLSDFGDDVVLLADHLGLDRFCLTGFSLGGIYVIICAALLGERIDQAIIVNTPSLPLEISDMTEEWQQYYRTITRPIIGPRLLKKQRDTLFKITDNPDAFLQSEAGVKMLKTLSENDVKLWEPSHIRNVILQSSVESYRQGSNSIKAIIQEAKLVKKGWDIDLSKIPYDLIHIWHGAMDRVIPVSNAYKNKQVIPGAHLNIFENEGHSLFFHQAEKMGEVVGSTPR